MTLINKIKRYFIQIGTREFDLLDLIQIIKNLITVNNCPDISIREYDEPLNQKRIRGELVTCTGEMIVAQICINADLYKDHQLEEHIRENILKDIGYKFIKKAYEERQNNIITEPATKFLYSCKEIHNANIQFKMS